MNIAQETSQTSKYIITYNDTCSHEMHFFFQILLQSSNSDSKLMGVMLVQDVY